MGACPAERERRQRPDPLTPGAPNSSSANGRRLCPAPSGTVAVGLQWAHTWDLKFVISIWSFPWWPSARTRLRRRAGFRGCRFRRLSSRQFASPGRPALFHLQFSNFAAYPIQSLPIKFQPLRQMLTALQCQHVMATLPHPFPRLTILGAPARSLFHCHHIPHRQPLRRNVHNRPVGHLGQFIAVPVKPFHYFPRLPQPPPLRIPAMHPCMQILPDDDFSVEFPVHHCPDFRQCV